MEAWEGSDRVIGQRTPVPLSDHIAHFGDEVGLYSWVADECDPRRTAASRASREGGGVWERAGTPVWVSQCKKALVWCGRR